MKSRNIYRYAIVLAIVLGVAFVCRLAAAQPEQSDASQTADAEVEVEVESGAPDEEIPDAESGLIYDIDDMDSGYLILVNKTHELDRDYKPDDLSDIKYYASDRSPEGRYMRAAAADAFHSLVEEAEMQGIGLVVTTAYRSFGFQTTLYNNYVARDGQAAADKYSAEPGKSEHQTGLAADVSSSSVNYKLTSEFADMQEGLWLSENANLFGFIIRYPDGKEDITGYQYEPWHIRYVGPAAAEYIYKNRITLEEYLQLFEEETLEE